MNIKNFEFRIVSRVLFLFVTLFAFSFFIVKGWYLFAALLSPLIFYQVIDPDRQEYRTAGYTDLEAIFGFQREEGGAIYC